ncbi:MAG: crotonase/enoyl-CoA hydratase family protein [Polyangiaceae bacterium]|nr:crotonase/enoyl-CoA hydratase family protein [Polyangiaceae bacterium]
MATVTLTTTTMPPAFFEDIEAAFRRINADDTIRAVIVRSSCKAFSYGLDLPAAFQALGPHLGGAMAGPRAELHAWIRRLQGSFDAVAACPVPVIAAIHGYCIGGGLDLAAACDVRLAAADAKISLRETKIAIVADLGSLQRLPAIIGQGHTRELAFTGKDVTAARAKEIGLVNDVFPDRDALLAAARAMAAEIAATPPLTVRGVKQVLNFGEGQTVAEGLAYVATWNSAFLASEDLGEALAAFLEKRPPRYKGR